MTADREEIVTDPARPGHDIVWEETGWWRVVETLPSGLPGRMWCETSAWEEAREALKECPYPSQLQCHQRRTDQRWVTVR
jgi:hypothetical protein